MRTSLLLKTAVCLALLSFSFSHVNVYANDEGAGGSSECGGSEGSGSEGSGTGGCETGDCGGGPDRTAEDEGPSMDAEFEASEAGLENGENGAESEAQGDSEDQGGSDVAMGAALEFIEHMIDPPEVNKNNDTELQHERDKEKLRRERDEFKKELERRDRERDEQKPEAPYNGLTEIALRIIQIIDKGKIA